MAASETRPEDHLPLPPQIFSVLVALGDEVRHGYGIIQAYERLTGGGDTLLPGSLYGTLSRMVKAGFLVEVEPPPGEVSGGPPRRYYQVTAFGREVARAEAERMERLLSVVRDAELAAGGSG